MARNTSVPMRVVSGAHDKVVADTPALGEILFDTGQKTLVAGDGSTKGGHPMATQAFVEAALAALDIDEKNDVKLNGDQTIAGIKTFSSSPIVPTPAATDNSTKVASTAFVKNVIWAKRVDGALPEDVSAIVANMPVGGIVLHEE